MCMILTKIDFGCLSVISVFILMLASPSICNGYFSWTDMISIHCETRKLSPTCIIVRLSSGPKFLNASSNVFNNVL